MDFMIRDCCLDDAKYIQDLNFNEMGYDYSLEETQAKLANILASEKDKIFVAVINNMVVGYVHANDYELIYAPSMKNIMGIAVSSTYRGNGIGRALLSKVEEWAKVSGAKGVRLVSGSTRIGAHEFYRRMGYHNEKQQLNFQKWL